MFSVLGSRRDQYGKIQGMAETGIYFDHLQLIWKESCFTDCPGTDAKDAQGRTGRKGKAEQMRKIRQPGARLPHFRNVFRSQ